MSNAGTAQKSHKPPVRRISLDWQEYAACQGIEDPNIFHDKARYEEALAICRQCPVTLQCRRHGIGQGDGVYGGMIQNGRIKQPDYRKPPTADHRCGTVAGHSAHRRRGERPCEGCRVANNISSHGRRTKR